MAKNTRTEISLQFPIEGIDQTLAYTRQRQGTTIDAQNVRSFEPATNRARGSMRSGMVKFFDGAAVTVTGPGDAATDQVYPIQDINYLISTELTPPSVFGDFAYAQAVAAGFGIADGDSGASVYSGLGAVSGFQFANSCWDDENNCYVAEVNQTTGAINLYCIGASGAVTWTQSTLTCATGTNRNVPGMVVCGDYLFVALTTNTTYLVANASCRITRITKSTGAVETAAWKLCSSIWTVFFSEQSQNCMNAIGSTLYVEGRNAVAMFVISMDSLTGGPNAYLGIYVYPAGTVANISRTKIVTDGTFLYVIGSRLTSQIMKLSASLQLQWASAAADPPNSITYDKKSGQLIAAASTAPSIRSINLTNGNLLTSAVAASIIWDEIDCDSQGSFVVWKNSQASNDVMGLSSTLGTVWGPSSLANAIHTGASVNKGTSITTVMGGARQIRSLLVAGGQCVAFNEDGPVAITGGQAFNASIPQVFSAQNGQNMFFADGFGYFYYKADVNKIVEWTATAPGVLPKNSPIASASKLVETWNGRTVLALGATIYMSAQNDPFDWDYDPETVTETTAFFGNLPSQGGEIINCVIPFRDDTLVVGCDHSLWVLMGDPRVGGRFDNISSSVGMLFGRPWARSAEGEQIYFMSNTGSVYKLSPGSMPIRVSQQIDRMLENVDLSSVRVSMAWDLQMRGLAVFVTPIDRTQPTTHFFYEERTNSWWKDVFKNKLHNPMAVCVYDGDLPEDRRILLGGGDGCLRILSNDAATDDGVAIESYVWLGPLSMKKMDEIMLEDIQPTLGEDSGDVRYAVHVGRTAEEAFASEAVRSGTWGAGRNRVTPIYRSGFAVFIKLSATTPFAIERIRVKYRTLGAVRRIM